MCMKKIVSILFLSVVMLTVYGAGRTVRRCTPAADVQIYSMGLTNFRVEALNVDPFLTARPYSCDNLSRKERKALADSWDKEYAPAFGPAGVMDVYAASGALNVVAFMWMQTGRAVYAEAVETLLLNVLTAAVRYPRDPIERHVAAAALLNGVGAAFGSDDEAVYVNYYIGSGVHVDDGVHELRLDVLTAFPADGRVRVRVRGLAKNGTRECIRLRLPSWAGGCPVVRVNGRETVVRVVGGYIEVNRSWNNGDEVYFEFPLVPRVVREGNRAVVLLGPLAYACPVAAERTSFFLDGPLSLGEIEGSDCLSIVARAVCEDTPGETVEVALLPYALTRGELWLPAVR